MDQGLKIFKKIMVQHLGSFNQSVFGSLAP